MSELRCGCVVELVVVAPGRSRVEVKVLDPLCEYAAHRLAARVPVRRRTVVRH
jgi:hypothetical protein